MWDPHRGRGNNIKIYCQSMFHFPLLYIRYAVAKALDQPEQVTRLQYVRADGHYMHKRHGWSVRNARALEHLTHIRCGRILFPSLTSTMSLSLDISLFLFVFGVFVPRAVADVICQPAWGWVSGPLDFHILTWFELPRETKLIRAHFPG